MHGIRLILTFSCILSAFITIICAPVNNTTTTTEKCKEMNVTEDEDYELIDQRQNGTENYRVNVKGVLLVITPLESLITAAQLVDTDLINSEEEFEKPEKPQGNHENPEVNLIDGSIVNITEKPKGKPKGSKLRFPSFLIPFIRKGHQEGRTYQKGGTSL